ncbi:alpha/beta fold hydrolase [Pararobbsia silviterrae]|uniref:Alpha/beta hydrolase n=1 Tax=Pararobbsia silviterrae TaxID=1792498 RepID=A0A494Y5T9_9BURK|nr:alpha/beta hydrolase [Pararobbsia silviterrae]RKP55941.1 alpha/beta hydrolase [Pararobbsia silviterrae]
MSHLTQHVLQHRYAALSEVKLHYVSQGEGPVILFVHGFPEFWYAWKAQIDALSASYRCVAVDMRGYNLSDKPIPVSAYGPKQIVGDLHELVAHLGGPVYLVAHDWGGAMAWEFATRFPEQIRKLVIINAPHACTMHRELRENPAQREASDYFALFRSDKAERVLSEDNFARLQQMFETWDVGGHRVTREIRHRYLDAWSRPGGLTGGLDWYRASRLVPPSCGTPNVEDFELDPRNHQVTVPTMVIWGERDTALLPSLLDGLDAYVRDLRIERIPEGSHWVHHEYPERINALIGGFFDGSMAVTNPTHAASRATTQVA